MVRKKKREAKEHEKEMAKRMIGSSAKSGGEEKEAGGAPAAAVPASQKTKTLAERWIELNISNAVRYAMGALLVYYVLNLIVGGRGKEEL